MYSGLFQATFLMIVIPILFGIMFVSEILFYFFKKQFLKNISLATQKSLNDIFKPKGRRRRR